MLAAWWRSLCALPCRVLPLLPAVLLLATSLLLHRETLGQRPGATFGGSEKDMEGDGSKARSRGHHKMISNGHEPDGEESSLLSGEWVAQWDDGEPLKAS